MTATSACCFRCFSGDSEGDGDAVPVTKGDLFYCFKDYLGGAGSWLFWLAEFSCLSIELSYIFSRFFALDYVPVYVLAIGICL